MEEKSKIKITIEVEDVSRYNTHQRDDKMSWETAYTDVSLDEMLSALEGMFMTMGFVSIPEAFIEYGIEKVGGTYIPADEETTEETDEETTEE